MRLRKEVCKNGISITRVTRPKEKAKATYDRISPWYDLLTRRGEKRFREVGLQKLGAEEGEVVLEIGFGTGTCILALAKSVGNSGKVLGMDISKGMFNIAHAKVRKAGLSKRVELKCGDAINLPFEANVFDAILMSFTLELFDTPEIPIVLRECQRVLRYGGRICVVAMSKEAGVGLAVKLYEWMHRRFPVYVDCRPILVQKSLKDAGFHVVDATEMSMWGLPVEIVVAKKRN